MVEFGEQLRRAREAKGDDAAIPGGTIICNETGILRFSECKDIS